MEYPMLFTCRYEDTTYGIFKHTERKLYPFSIIKNGIEDKNIGFQYIQDALTYVMEQLFPNLDIEIWGEENKCTISANK